MTSPDFSVLILGTYSTSHPSVPSRWTSLFALLTTVLNSYSSVKHELMNMGKVDLLLLQTEFDLLQQLVKILENFDT